MDNLQGEDTTPSPSDQENTQMHTENDGENPQEEEETIPFAQINNTRGNEVPKATSATFKPVATEVPKIKLPSQRINTQIQYMKDDALIGKFIGFWPTEKAL